MQSASGIRTVKVPVPGRLERFASWSGHGQPWAPLAPPDTRQLIVQGKLPAQDRQSRLIMIRIFDDWPHEYRTERLWKRAKVVKGSKYVVRSTYCTGNVDVPSSLLLVV